MPQIHLSPAPNANPALTAGSPAARFAADGFLSPVRIVSEAAARDHRTRLEKAEAAMGRSLHYLAKIHTVLNSPWELASHPTALDIVENLIGPDILIYNVSYIIKEPNTANFVSWHQDLTYWGFDGDRQVSMWLALSPTDSVSGCMRMIPGSHRDGQLTHDDTHDPDNVLSRGQQVAAVDESLAVSCPLTPGEASFHHGWALHASSPNHANDRRIGLNVQYISPGLRQIAAPSDTALLVRGHDQYGFYGADIPANSDLAPDALKRLTLLDARLQETWRRARSHP